MKIGYSMDILELDFTTEELEWLCWVNELAVHELLSKFMVDYKIKVNWVEQKFGQEIRSSQKLGRPKYSVKVSTW